MRAIRIGRWGGPEVLEYVEDAPVPEPAAHELRVAVSRAGISFADTHARDNSYLAPNELPLTPGGEVAGRTEDGRRGAATVGFWLAHCFARPQEMLAEPLGDLFERVAAGTLKVVEGTVYPLSDARRAHKDLQARRTTGKLLLDPAS